MARRDEAKGGRKQARAGGETNAEPKRARGGGQTKSARRQPDAGQKTKAGRKQSQAGGQTKSARRQPGAGQKTKGARKQSQAGGQTKAARRQARGANQRSAPPAPAAVPSPPGEDASPEERIEWRLARIEQVVDAQAGRSEELLEKLEGLLDEAPQAETSAGGAADDGDD